MHGAQSGGWRMISAVGAKGRVVAGFVGPKITSVGVHTAEPICAAPVSFVIRMSAILMMDVASATEVLPVRTTGRCRVWLNTRSEISASALDPINITCEPDS